MATSAPPPLDYVTRQGATLPTFEPPPLNGSTYVGEWIDWHVEKSANHNFAVLIGAKTEGKINITWGEGEF